MEEKVRENRLRRTLDRRGYRLEKSRRRDPHAVGFGGYMIVDKFKNCLVAGDDYNFTLDDVEAFLTRQT